MELMEKKNTEKKKPAFAGAWYPANAVECKASIQRFLKEKQGPLGGRFAGGIVPHAGWYYSGSIACRVIASLGSDTDTIVLFGAHMHTSSPPFILTHGWIETPLGDIEVDHILAEHICEGITIAQKSPFTFPDENTFELQYPFIKYFYPDAKIVVCGVAPTPFAAAIGTRAVDAAKKLSRNIRVIGSTDMSHYGPDFGFTSAGTGKKAVEWVKNQNDRNAIEAMKQMDPEKIIAQGLDHQNMCCSGAAAATAAACKKLGAVKAIELDYATSFEKTASASFVGYSGILYALS